MQVQNNTPYVRVVQLRRADEKTGEEIIHSFPVEPGKVAHIPDDVWAEVGAIGKDRLWGLVAKPDAKLVTTKVKASQAISLVIACTDPRAIDAALEAEDRKSVIAALQARAEELASDGGEASN